MDLKRVYYYVICLASLLVLLWGTVDLVSISIGFMSARTSQPSVPVAIEKESEQYMDIYYQKRILYDRLSDSLARFIIAGAVFVYSRKKINRLER